jgi:hypothetical protein
MNVCLECALDPFISADMSSHFAEVDTKMISPKWTIFLHATCNYIGVGSSSKYIVSILDSQQPPSFPLDLDTLLYKTRGHSVVYKSNRGVR